MSTLTPVSTFEGNEKDWAHQLGMLDWDTTRIIFTKRELLNFLKYIGTSVDPNYNNISKLPRYAAFGLLEGGAAKTVENTAASGGGGGSSYSGDFVPTRRVREAPGGKSSISFYDDSQDDALSTAPPPKPVEEPPKAQEQASITKTATTEEPEGLPAPTGVPSRRVRDPPGGKDSLKSLWDATEEEEFIPTRRVRDQPGGQGSIGSIY